MKYTFLALSAFLVCVGGWAGEILNIPKIAGKSEKVVSETYGKPSSCERSKYGRHCIYEASSLEIVFINDKADWITVGGLSRVPFNEQSIAALGFTGQKPTFRSGEVIRWETLAGIREVSIFNANGHVDYAYVKVKTK